MTRHGFLAIATSLLVLFVALIAARAEAATNQWTPIGPQGGIITGLAFDATPSLAYATASGGFFRSVDAGASWQPSNDGLQDAHLHGLVRLGRTIYVGGADGVSRSDDHGVHFRRLANAPTLVSAIAAGVGKNPPLFAAGIFAGAWRSDDGGATWQEIDEGLERDQTEPAGEVNALLVDPHQPELLWAGSNFGVYRSFDGGAHWSRVSAGVGCTVSSLALDTRSTLYAGCFIEPTTPAPLPAPLFVSFDLGSTWHPSAHGLPARGVAALLADPAGAVWAGTQGAGVLRSVDGGRHWSPAGKGTAGQAIGALAQAPLHPSLLLAGGGVLLEATGDGPGIFRTTSSGASWALAGPGPDATFLLSIAADASIPGQLTATDLFTGAYRSGSGGVAWRSFDAGLPPAPSIGQIEGDTVTSGEIYATTLFERPILFRRSADPPGPWRRLPGVPPPCIGTLTVGARGQLFLGAFDLTSGDGHGGLCASQDGGASWTIADVGFISVLSIAVAPSNPSRVYASGVVTAGANPALGFQRSDDGGVTWTAESAISTMAAPGLAVDPVDADLIYAAAAAGVERSRDGGVTWELVLPGHATMVRVDPKVPGTIYAAPGTMGSFFLPPPPEPLLSVSDDGGATWSPLAAGLPPNVPVLDLAFDAGTSSLLYAATAGGGAYRLKRER